VQNITDRGHATSEVFEMNEQTINMAKQEVPANVSVERTKIAANEANRAELLVGTDLDRKAKEIATSEPWPVRWAA
jgi:hypothetical protein